MHVLLILLCLLISASPCLGATMAEQIAQNPAAAANARAQANAPRLRTPITPAASTIYTGNPALAPGSVTVQNTVTEDLDDYDDAPIATIPDPLEPWNRFWFRFNDIFYIHVAQPAYKAWTYITPSFLRTGMSNLFYNTLFPTRFINSLLQGRPREAGVEFSRFMMNMMGSAGMVDLASSKKTIVPVDPSGEDFGQTLGRWGIGQGFYIVWPIIGPSTVRDTIGRVGDAFTSPLYYIDPWVASLAANAAFRFNDLNDVLPAYLDLSSIAVDPYIAMREAYISMRKAQVDR